MDVTELYAELVATLAYEDEDGVALARRHRVAIKNLLILPEESTEEGRSLRYNHKTLAAQLDVVTAYINANAPQTDAQRLNNPSVLHADFSTFGGYAG